MTHQETIEKKYSIDIDFANHLMDNPSLAGNLHDDFKLEFIEKDFPTNKKKEQMTNDYKKEIC